MLLRILFVVLTIPALHTSGQSTTDVDRKTRQQLEQTAREFRGNLSEEKGFQRLLSGIFCQGRG
jgi:hypothetical protein